jgi:hypothetical protein
MECSGGEGLCSVLRNERQELKDQRNFIYRKEIEKVAWRGVWWDLESNSPLSLVGHQVL